MKIVKKHTVTTNPIRFKKYCEVKDNNTVCIRNGKFYIQATVLHSQLIMVDTLTIKYTARIF